MLVEVAGGLLSGSLALLADAGHMLTDFAALSMAWLAFRVARRPADARAHLRLRPPLGARRLRQRPGALRRRRLDRRRGRPPPRTTRSRSTGGIMLAVAAAGLARQHRSPSGCCRAATAATSTSAPRCCTSSGDLLGSVGAIVAALVILWTGWTPIDPILSVLVSLLILRSAWRGGARQRPHPARRHARGLRRRRHRRRPRAPPCPRSPPSATCTPGRSPRTRPMVTLEAVVAPGADPEAARAADQGPPRRGLRLRPRHRRDLRRGPRRKTRGCPRRAARLSRRSPSPRRALDADQDPRDPSRPRRAPARGRDGDVGGDGAAPGHPPAADRPPQPDAEEGADRDAVRPRDRRDAAADRADADPHVRPRVASNTSAAHLEAFYQPFREARERHFDGLIITGAPIEHLDFEAVSYWRRAARGLRLDPDQRAFDHGRLLGRHGDAAPLPRHPEAHAAGQGLRLLPPPRRSRRPPALLQGFSDSFDGAGQPLDRGARRGRGARTPSSRC